MSPIFVKQFKDHTRCADCTGMPAKGRSLCSRHLEVAHLAWTVWAYHRRKSGFCVDCRKKAVTGTGRCQKHRELNNARGRQWNLKNPRGHHEAYLLRRRRYTENGMCYRCASHTKLTPEELAAGRVNCADCMGRAIAYKKGGFLLAQRKADMAAKRDAIQRARTGELAKRMAELGYKPNFLDVGRKAGWSSKKLVARA